MLHILSLLFWYSVGTAGVLLIYASLSYETDEGKIQSLLELWWIKVDDYRQQSLSRHVAFIKMLATVVTNVFDRLFGDRLISVQAFAVSIGYSFVCMGILALIVRKFDPTPKITLSDGLWLIVEGAIVGSVPALLSRWKYQIYGITPVHVWCISFILYQVWGLKELFSFLVAFFVIGLTTPGAGTGVFLLLGAVVSVIAAFCLFAVFVAIMRGTIRTISTSTSPMKIVGLSSLNATPIVMFYALIMLAFDIPELLGGLGLVITMCMLLLGVFGIVFNLVFILSAVFFVCLAVTMLLHRLFWPAISRPLYKLQALGIAKRPKVFAAIGVVLTGLGFGKYEWLSSLISKF